MPHDQWARVTAGLYAGDVGQWVGTYCSMKDASVRSYLLRIVPRISLRGTFQARPDRQLFNSRLAVIRFGADAISQHGELVSFNPEGDAAHKPMYIFHDGFLEASFSEDIVDVKNIHLTGEEERDFLENKSPDLHGVRQVCHHFNSNDLVHLFTPYRQVQ